MFRPLPYTMYGNCRDKRLSLQVRMDRHLSKETGQKMALSSLRRASADPQRPFRGADHRSDGLTRPKLDYY